MLIVKLDINKTSKGEPKQATNLIRTFIKNHFSEHGDFFHVYKIDANCINIVINTNNLSSIQNRAKKLYNDLTEQDIYIIISISNTVTDLKDLYISYNNARLLLLNSNYSEEKIRLYDPHYSYNDKIIYYNYYNLKDTLSVMFTYITSNQPQQVVEVIGNLYSLYPDENIYMKIFLQIFMIVVQLKNLIMKYTLNWQKYMDLIS